MVDKKSAQSVGPVSGMTRFDRSSFVIWESDLRIATSWMPRELNIAKGIYVGVIRSQCLFGVCIT